MKEVAKAQFREIYFRLGGGDRAGWGIDYWNRFFEVDREGVGMNYFVEEPETPEHTRMMISSDFGSHTYRLYFLTEEAEESFFDSPHGS